METLNSHPPTRPHCLGCEEWQRAHSAALLSGLCSFWEAYAGLEQSLAFWKAAYANLLTETLLAGCPEFFPALPLLLYCMIIPQYLLLQALCRNALLSSRGEVSLCCVSGRCIMSTALVICLTITETKQVKLLD